MPPYFLIALIVPVIAIGLTRYFYDDSIPHGVRKIHPQSFVAPGFERVRDRFEYSVRYYVLAWSFSNSSSLFYFVSIGYYFKKVD